MILLCIGLETDFGFDFEEAGFETRFEAAELIAGDSTESAAAK
jgi:hypothetical protein